MKTGEQIGLPPSTPIHIRALGLFEMSWLNVVCHSVAPCPMHVCPAQRLGRKVEPFQFVKFGNLHCCTLLLMLIKQRDPNGRWNETLMKQHRTLTNLKPQWTYYNVNVIWNFILNTLWLANSNIVTSSITGIDLSPSPQAALSMWNKRVQKKFRIFCWFCWKSASIKIRIEMLVHTQGEHNSYL